VLLADCAAKLIRKLSGHSGIGEAPSNVVAPVFAAAASALHLYAVVGVKLMHGIQFPAEAAFRHEHFHNVRNACSVASGVVRSSLGIARDHTKIFNAFPVGFIYFRLMDGAEAPESSSTAQLMHRGPLISELEDAVRHGSQEKRVKTLRGITDLFLNAKERLSEEQIKVFDEVLCHLITRMEARALIELSERLAPINNASSNVIHTLAVDDEIAIAGPVLSLSDRLTTPDLVEIAMAKS